MNDPSVLIPLINHSNKKIPPLSGIFISIFKGINNPFRPCRVLRDVQQALQALACRQSHTQL